MKNPYEILGVSPNATDAEVKAAYRELARKYHPDHYADNPLSDLAQEKMKEINNAYDTIVRDRQRSSGGGSSQTNHTQYTDIRTLIMQRRYAQAEELLDGIPSASRNAEWHYLKGQVLYQRGWLEEANRHFYQAVNMDPYNAEYRAAVNRSHQQRSGQYTASGGYGNASGGCDICSSLLCADCCCECMGGNLIPCCGCR